jgi:hypothetical protein
MSVTNGYGVFAGKQKRLFSAIGHFYWTSRDKNTTIKIACFNNKISAPQTVFRPQGGLTQPNY